MLSIHNLLIRSRFLLKLVASVLALMFGHFRNLLSFFSGMNDKLFLVDFGLASRYLHLGIHRPFEPDQRSAHEGTLEYVSRDGHLGCVSRRGDMECLLYVIIEWLGGHLPWDTDDDER